MIKIEKSNVENIMALTAVQEGMLFHYLKTLNKHEYFEQLVLDITGNIEKEFFEEAWHQVVENNEMLRTLFRWEKLDKAIQIVLKKHAPRISFYDFQNDAIDATMAIEDIKRKDYEEGFDLSEPAFRITLCKKDENQYVLMISNHHIILDGWSTGILLKEFFLSYNALTLGGQLSKSRKTPFSDYIKHIQRIDKSQEEVFWKKYLENYQLKNNFSTEAIEADAVLKHYSMTLDKTIEEKMKHFAKDNRVTLAEVFYSAWGILLSRYNDCEDVVFGTTVSGRNIDLKGIEDLVGLFINTVPLRVNLGNSINTTGLLGQIKSDLEERRNFEKTSLLDIKNYCNIDMREKLFDSIVVIENYPLDERLMADNSSLLVNDYSIKEETNYGIVLGIELRDQIKMTLTCKPSSLGHVAIESCLEHFNQILSELVESSEKLVKHINLLSRQEGELLLKTFNNTQVNGLKIKTIHELFEDQVEKTPDHIALIFENKQLTYRELNDKSNAIAYALRQKGLTAERKVAIMVNRSMEMIIGIIGILKSGAAYVPIDPTYPKERILYMLEDSESDVLLTQGDLSSKIDYNGEIIDLENISIYEHKIGNCDCINSISDLAYIIYTSGSTGKPKGVLIEHKSIVNTLLWRVKHYDFGIEDAVLQIPSFSFDSSVEDIFSPLISGGRLVLIRQSERLNLEYLRKTIINNKITHFLIVPSLYKSLLDEIHETLTSMRTVTVAGENFTRRLVEEHFLKLPNVRLFNEYGPTENSVCSTVYEFDKEHTKILIGRAIDNTKCYVLNKDNKLQPIGIASELCLSGDGLSRGYHNRVTLTDEKFLENPFEKSSLMYRTGDLVRWLPNGNIEFLGRIDHQVKIRGYRIELKEIENVMIKHQSLVDVAVWAWEKEDGDKYLCAYIVSEDELSNDEIRTYLKQEIPDYMIPSYFESIDKIPLTPNGKLDTKALIKPQKNLSSKKSYQAPSNERETALVGIWQNVLSIKEAIGIEDNFYELGGNSIKAMQIVGRINKKFDVSIKLKNFLLKPTIKELAIEVLSATNGHSIALEKTEDRDFYELSYNQRKLWTIGQIDKENTAYNMTGKLRLDHRVDKDAARRALKSIVRRHDSLRTGFKVVNNIPVQFIETNEAIDLIEIDLSSYELEKRNKENEKLLDNEKRHIFDMKSAFLFRMTLVELGDEVFELIFNMHHIISDGWSIDILKKEFFHYYDAYKKNVQPSLPAIEFQYKDFSTWQNRMIMDQTTGKSAHEYWKSQIENTFVRTNLPYDYKDESHNQESAGYVSYLDNGTKEKLLALSIENNLTLFTLMFSSFNAFLSKITGQKDIVCGVPSSGRHHIALHNTVGFFINSIILRNNIDHKKTFLELANQVNNSSLEAFEHQDYPLELVLEEEKMRYPEIQVFFNMLNFSQTESFKELESFENYHVPKVQNAKFDLVIYLEEYSNGIELTCNYKKHSFKASTIEYIMQEYVKVIDFFVNNPEGKLHDLKKKNKRRIL